MYLQDKLYVDTQTPKEIQLVYTEDLAGLIAWLETKDPNEKYNWMNGQTCLFTQFAQALGKDYYMDISELYDHYDGRCSIAYSRPRTMGAALKRAKRVQRREQIRVLPLWKRPLAMCNFLSP